jgi:hypothetical protein
MPRRRARAALRWSINCRSRAIMVSSSDIPCRLHGAGIRASEARVPSLGIVATIGLLGRAVSRLELS